MAAPPAAAQETAFVVNLFDHTNIRSAGNTYIVTPDSVVIWGLADYGRLRIDYLRRALDEKERRKIVKFLAGFPFGELEDAYTGDTSVAYADEHYVPRMIELSGRAGNRSFYSKATACYAANVARFCQFMNGFFPPEVAVRLDKRDFETRFP
jgi:hypothetical protein